MKDSFDIAEDVISLISTPEVTTFITGKIYADSRPNNSNKQDIVVRVLAGTNEWIQNAVVVINGDGFLLPDSDKPDMFKMRDLGKILTQSLEGQYRNEFFTEIVNPAQVRTDRDGSKYLNIRVRYRSIQNNFKNV
jgi:hypothetical protein